MTTPTPDRTPLMTFVRERWVAIVLVILTFSFIVQNRNRVDINLFWLHLSWPLWLVLALIAAIGSVIGYLASRRRHR